MRLLQLRESAALLWALLLSFWCSIAAQIFGAISRVWWQKQKKWGNTIFALLFFFFFFFCSPLPFTFIPFALFSHCAQAHWLLSYSAAPLSLSPLFPLVVFYCDNVQINDDDDDTTGFVKNQCCSLRERERVQTNKWQCDTIGKRASRVFFVFCLQSIFTTN